MLAQGHVDVARYLMSRPIAGVRYDPHAHDELCLSAAAGGHAGSMALIHDRVPLGSGSAPCACPSEVGYAAWGAPLPEAALWLKAHGCAGYEAPNNYFLAEAIADGRDDTLRAILAEIDPTCRVPSAAIDRALRTASEEGSLATLTIAAAAGLVVRPLPLFVGASEWGHTTVLDYAESLFGTPRDALRAAAVAAAGSSNGAGSMRWIASRRPDVVDVPIMWLAIRDAEVDVVRVVDALLPEPFDWQRAAHTVLKSGDVGLLRFAVEEKGMVIDAMVVQSGVTLRSDTTDYLVARYGLDRMQPVFDAAAITASSRGKTRDLGWLDRVGGACTAERYLAQSMDALYRTTPDDEAIRACACHRCRRPNSPRPSKRSRTDPLDGAPDALQTVLDVSLAPMPKSTP